MAMRKRLKSPPGTWRSISVLLFWGIISNINQNFICLCVFSEQNIPGDPVPDSVVTAVPDQTTSYFCAAQVQTIIQNVQEIMVSFSLGLQLVLFHYCILRGFITVCVLFRVLNVSLQRVRPTNGTEWSVKPCASASPTPPTLEASARYPEHHPTSSSLSSWTSEWNVKPSTHPNADLTTVSAYRMYPNCNCINFGNWLLLCFPISLIMLVLTWLWLYWLFIGSEWVLSQPISHSAAVCCCAQQDGTI